MTSKRKARTIRENGITWHLDPFQSKTARKAEHCVAVFDNVGKVLALLERNLENTALRDGMTNAAIEIEYMKSRNFYNHKDLSEIKF